MDTDKLYQELLNDKDIDDIPIIFVMRVACSIIKILNEGKCFRVTEV